MDFFVCNAPYPGYDPVCDEFFFVLLQFVWMGREIVLFSVSLFSMSIGLSIQGGTVAAAFLLGTVARFFMRILSKKTRRASMTAEKPPPMKRRL